MSREPGLRCDRNRDLEEAMTHRLSLLALAALAFFAGGQTAEPAAIRQDFNVRLIDVSVVEKGGTVFHHPGVGRCRLWSAGRGRIRHGARFGNLNFAGINQEKGGKKEEK